MPEREFYIKEGDTRRPLFATLLDPDTGQPETLEAASVLFRLARQDDGVVVLEEPADLLLDGALGGVRFAAWTAEHTAQAGFYWGEFEVTYQDGAVTSYPIEARGIPVVIVKDL